MRARALLAVSIVSAVAHGCTNAPLPAAEITQVDAALAVQTSPDTAPILAALADRDCVLPDLEEMPFMLAHGENGLFAAVGTSTFTCGTDRAGTLRAIVFFGPEGALETGVAGHIGRLWNATEGPMTEVILVDADGAVQTFELTEMWTQTLEEGLDALLEASGASAPLEEASDIGGSRESLDAIDLEAWGSACADILGITATPRCSGAEGCTCCNCLSDSFYCFDYVVNSADAYRQCTYAKDCVIELSTAGGNEAGEACTQLAMTNPELSEDGTVGTLIEQNVVNLNQSCQINLQQNALLPDRFPDALARLADGLGTVQSGVGAVTPFIGLIPGGGTVVAGWSSVATFVLKPAQALAAANGRRANAMEMFTKSMTDGYLGPAGGQFYCANYRQEYNCEPPRCAPVEQRYCTGSGNCYSWQRTTPGDLTCWPVYMQCDGGWEPESDCDSGIEHYSGQEFVYNNGGLGLAECCENHTTWSYPTEADIPSVAGYLTMQARPPSVCAWYRPNGDLPSPPNFYFVAGEDLWGDTCSWSPYVPPGVPGRSGALHGFPVTHQFPVSRDECQ